MQNTVEIAGSVGDYYELEEKEDRFSVRKQGIIEDRIFSREADDFDDLAVKTRLALHTLDNKNASHSEKEKEEMFRNILHDVMVVYAQHKLDNAGSYESEAPVNYYNLFYPRG
ncbi:MAG: hypothetical protein ACLFRA_08215 [Alphaproteobacteria bacterium]